MGMDNGSCANKNISDVEKSSTWAIRMKRIEQHEQFPSEQVEKKHKNYFYLFNVNVLGDVVWPGGVFLQNVFHSDST